MNLSKHEQQKVVYFLITTLMLLSLSYFLATNAFIFWDVSWHIEGAKRMLTGGTYLTNLVDDNSPAVFAFYIPYIMLSKIISMTPYKLAFLYILLAFTLSNTLSYKVLKQKLSNQYAIYVLYISCLIISLTLSITILGQRENILITFSMPYVLLNILNHFEANKPSEKKLSASIQCLIALFAIIGFSQIPFYLFAALILDVIDWTANKRKPQAYQWMFYAGFTLTMALSFFLYPEYYQVLLKLLYKFQAGLDSSYTMLLDNTFFKLSVFSLFMLTIIAIFSQQKLAYIKLIGITAAALVIYILEKKEWFYHFYPALSYLFLAFSIFIVDNKINSEQLARYKFIKYTTIIIYILFFFFIFSFITSNYLTRSQKYHNKKNAINQLIAYSKATTNNSTLFISTRVYPAYILALYANVDILSPWANAWMLPSLANPNFQPKNLHAFMQGKQLFFNLIIASLKKKPTYIIYPSTPYMAYVPEKFDAMIYLKQNKRVADLLNHYKFEKNIQQYRIFKRATD